MLRKLTLGGLAAALIAAGTAAADEKFATAGEAKELMQKAIAAMKDDETKALAMFAANDGPFRYKDLYVWCANASDGILTVHPTNKGKELRDIVGKKGTPFGETIMQDAAEGEIKQTNYWWPRPGEEKPLEKTTYYAKMGDQICGTGYYHQ